MRNILDKDFKFNKKFGQNFIFDSNFLNSVVSDAGVDSYTQVLEIGTGAGTLTKALAKSAKKVISFEIDENLKTTIFENLKNIDNVQVVFKDILKASIEEIEEHFDGEYILVANLPYYITTPIIFKFLEEATKLKRLVIMVQLEVANRLCAKPNSKDYGTITPMIDFMGNAKIMRKVSRKMFMPMPNVDSAIVRIDLIDNKFEIKDRKLLAKIIRSAFSMRRKTLINNLKNVFHLSNNELESLLLKIGVNINVRGENLSTEQFVLLSNEIYNILNN